MQIQRSTAFNLIIGVCILLMTSPLTLNAQETNSNLVPSAELDALPASDVSEKALTVEQISQQFVGAKLKQLPDIIDQLEANESPKVLSIFKTLLAGELYYLKDNEKLVEATLTEDKKYRLSDPYSKQPLDRVVAKKEIKKVKTANKIRKKLRLAIAKLSLKSESEATRLESINDILAGLDSQSLPLLEQAKETEESEKVIAKLTEAIAVIGLSDSDPSVRIESLTTLKGSLEPIVRNKILKLSENDGDDQVKALAIKTLESIDSKVSFYGYLERIFFGLSMGSILLLVAAGLAITFGVMGVINMAHGELIMLGAYTTYVVQLLMPNHLALSILVAIPAAFMVSALFGVLIERGVIQFLKGRPLETLLATFGISLILQQLVRTVFSPLNRQVATPEFMSGALQINPVFSLTYNRIYILVFALIVFFLLQLMMRKTSLGLYVRAVSQNRNMARSMGIRSEWVDAMTFGLGSGVAGLAGVALSQITNVGPNLGQAYIIDSFMVVVFGGVGNLWGTFVGAFTVGSLNKFLEPATGAVLANIIVLVFIILFIQRKPRGLFPQKGRAAES